MYLGVDEPPVSKRDRLIWRHAWNGRDRGLLEGLLLYEASLNDLGFPPHVYTDPDRVFEPDEVEDRAAKVLEETREEYQRGKNVTPGLRLVVRDAGRRSGAGRREQGEPVDGRGKARGEHGPSGGLEDAPLGG